MNYYMISKNNGPITRYLANATSLDEAERQAQGIWDDSDDLDEGHTDLEDDVPDLAWDDFHGDDHAWSQRAFSLAKSYRECDGFDIAGFDD